MNFPCDITFCGARLRIECLASGAQGEAFRVTLLEGEWPKSYTPIAEYISLADYHIDPEYVYDPKKPFAPPKSILITYDCR